MHRVFDTIFLAALLLVGGAHAAEARVELLRWRLPGSVAAEGFEVVVGTRSRAYDRVIDVGLPTAAADGSYAFALPVADAATVYVAVSAYNAAGSSPRSNEIARPVPPEPAPRSAGPGGPTGLSRSIFSQGTGLLSVTSPSEDELYVSLETPAGASPDGLELRGRVRIEFPGAGIGVTFREEGLPDAFYWLGRDPVPGSAFTLAATGAPLACRSGALPVPVPGAWHAFRFAVMPAARETVIAGKVWLEGSAEPNAWTVCSDASADRLLTIIPGLWGAGPGRKSWDRLQRVSPPW